MESDLVINRLRSFVVALNQDETARDTKIELDWKQASQLLVEFDCSNQIAKSYLRLRDVALEQLKENGENIAKRMDELRKTMERK